MCSVGDDFENDGEKHMPAMARLNLAESKCNKCKEEKPHILLRGKDAYCKNCFLVGANHKFKALLGKSRLLCPNDKVMVSYEVGHPSTALLHLVRTGLDLDTPKKLRFDPIVLFLEDQYHLTVNERHDMVSKVVKDVESFKLKGNLSMDQNDKEQINKKTFSKGTRATTKTEILSILKRNLLISIAKKLNCKFIFTPELSIDIASDLLTNMSLGRGSQVPSDTGFCDDRDEHIKILRPLRSFDNKELAFYNILHHLEPVSVRQPDINQYASVQDLMKKFVSDLQQNYPATVTTIVKTGDKLALDKSKVAEKCKFCKGIILEKNGELDSEESTNFSKLVSNQLPDHSISRQERYAKIVGKFDHLSQGHQEYCFSCSKISDYLLDD